MSTVHTHSASSIYASPLSYGGVLTHSSQMPASSGPNRRPIDGSQSHASHSSRVFSAGNVIKAFGSAAAGVLMAVGQAGQYVCGSIVSGAAIAGAAIGAVPGGFAGLLVGLFVLRPVEGATVGGLAGATVGGIALAAPVYIVVFIPALLSELVELAGKGLGHLSS